MFKNIIEQNFAICINEQHNLLTQNKRYWQRLCGLCNPRDNKIKKSTQ